MQDGDILHSEMGCEIICCEGLPRMLLNGPWKSSFADLASKLRVESLVASQTNGWRNRDLRFLKAIPAVKWLSISATLEPIGWKDLRYVAADLQSLRLDSSFPPDVLDFTEFPKLEFCHLRWHPEWVSIGSVQNLDRLSIASYTGNKALDLASLARLRSFRLKSVKSVEVVLSPTARVRTAEFISVKSAHLPLRFFTHLKELQLEWKLPFPTCRLRKAAKLEVLDLYKIKFTEPFLAQLPSLRHVKAVNCQFAAEDLEVIRALNRRGAARWERRCPQSASCKSAQRHVQTLLPKSHPISPSIPQA